jgi:hypothetical protein
MARTVLDLNKSYVGNVVAILNVLLRLLQESSALTSPLLFFNFNFQFKFGIRGPVGQKRGLNGRYMFDRRMQVHSTINTTGKLKMLSFRWAKCR